LKSLGQWYGGGTPSKRDRVFWTDGTIPWLSPKDMGAEVIRGTRDRITREAVERSSVKLVPAGSVVVVVRSGILERTLPVAVVPFETTLNQDMKALVPREGVDARWIAWGLRAFEQQLLRDTRKTGTTVASIETSRFKTFELPVPPLREQRRIVDLLEDHLSRLDAANQDLEIARTRLRRLRESALERCLVEASACAGSASSSLGELSSVGTGATPLKANPDFYTNGVIPWVTSGDLKQGLISNARGFVTQLALDKAHLKLYPPGTLLIAMYGEGKTRGTVGELGISATTNQACAAIQLRNPDLRPWVRLALDANYAAMRRLASGGVQPNLNLGMIRSIEMAIPPPSDRARMLSSVASIESAKARLENGLTIGVSRSHSLRRALLAAAFSGRLTGHASDLDRAEEVASSGGTVRAKAEGTLCV
jgi:type I restriction enzyme S subunit